MTIKSSQTRPLLAHFSSLMSLPSISSTNASLDMSNMPVINYLAEQFTALGFQCEIMPCESSSGEAKANLIATLGSGPGGLVLAGHTDTVPMDPELWSVDPLKMTEQDNRLYGLGSTDMKGFFALILEAVRDIADKPLQQPLIVLATSDEETSMFGARKIAELGRPKARYAIIGEPTGMKPIHAHKGVMMESIRLQGRSGHSSDPSLGINAMEAMHDVIGDLLKFRAELQEKYHNPLFAIDKPTMNLGCIHGGDNPNRICGHCELEFDIRLMPGMEVENMRELIRKRLQPLAQRWQVGFELTPLFPGAPAFHCPVESDLVKTAERLTGHTAGTVAFGTEAPWLQQIGIDTIVLGPGDIDQAHQPDEYLSLDRVKPCVDLLQQFITHYCLEKH
ncbi:acetylornithine deacetylase [Pseudohongiella sp. SYSU M77423]|uniref:acetylornithine deacetylase n=1 Tax=unclassified Pseudohongiella TaxID=2629611 RepID=UPI001F0007E0|nr:MULTISPECIES: acetylornithine deacetylase [unclassified Pseudohongiella]MDH7944118.1 acetylornithine deacetylase [Pseudohongiella sp. SYSU M77423]MEC8859322.1 acetylornithine deacetylase [Pseudomonadota bacterium]